MNLKQIRYELAELADADIAAHHQKFFKTGRGQYGEGDRFIGIRVPRIRALAKRCRDLPLNKSRTLLRSPIHEERMLALYVLVWQFPRSDAEGRRRILELYLDHTDRINNWDLVDSSAHLIVGPWLQDRDRGLLLEFARSASLWERRIAMIATLHFIRQNDFDDALRIAEELLQDGHDLIHKAVGWMLREVGNRDHEAEVEFLRPRYTRMPRTMLRYAIEKFPEPLRQSFLHGQI